MNTRIQYQIPRSLYVILLSLFSLLLISPFFVAILFAATVAFALFPFQLKLERKGWKSSRASGFIISLFTFAISIPFMFFISKGTILVIDFLEKFALTEKMESQGTKEIFTGFKHEIVAQILKYAERFPMANLLTEEKVYSYMKTANTILLDFFKSLSGSIPAGVLFFIVMVLCSFSFLSGSKNIRIVFQQLFNFSDHRMDQLIGTFLKNARQVYVSNLVTGLIQATVVATGVYFVLGYDWFLVFFITLVFSFIPVIGAAPVAFLFAAVAFIQAESTHAIILFILGGVTGLVDNILRPWLASYGESSAPASASFIFVIGGALLFGFPGLFIGLFVGAIAYDTLPIFWDELMKNDATKGIGDFFNFKTKPKTNEKDHLN